MGLSVSLRRLAGGFLCVLFSLCWVPAHAGGDRRPDTDSVVLRIQGSNTVGARLAPLLLAGLFESRGLRSVRIAPGDHANEQQVTGTWPDGRSVSAQVAAHGTGTGFLGLKDGNADLAAASRPIRQHEYEHLAGLGDLRSAEAEQVVAIDGLAIIVHPDNPVEALSVEQVARLFAGEIRNWRQLGGPDLRVEVHARDDQSGTYDTFRDLVLGSHGAALWEGAVRYESNDLLSERVSQTPGAIGFVSLASVGGARAVAIADGQAQPMLPTPAAVATEDYPLSRRLYFYASPRLQSQWTRDFLSFVHSPAGQAIVTQSGYVAQRILPVRQPVQPDMPVAYRTLASKAWRLTLNFRFAEGSARLDNKALRDVDRLVDYLNTNDKTMNAVVLVGFGDSRQDEVRGQLLSKLRAMAARRELVRHGILVADTLGLGAQLPVAADTALGRIRNRRVEVWVY